MTPEEGREKDQIERELRAKLESIDKRFKHLSRGTPVQREHIAEQVKALSRDAKSGEAFKRPEWQVNSPCDHVDALPADISKWLWRRRRRRTQLVALWLALLGILGLALIAIFK